MYPLQAPSRFPLDGFRFPFTFLLLSSLFILNASSTYDPRRRHYKENFDPAEADPRRNASCVGDSYDLKLPILDDGFNPNGLSMQKLCVKPQYGGGGQHRHAGAYCYNPIIPDSSESDDDSGSSIDSEFGEHELPIMFGKVIFDPQRSAQTNHLLQNPRILQACIYRCFCNYGIEDVSIQPKSNHVPIQKNAPGYGHGYQLQIDVLGDVMTPYPWMMGLIALSNLDTITIYKKPQIDARGAGYIAQPTYMSLDPGNKIECTGDLPAFIFPSPYSRNDFSSVQELCAVALSGGNKDVNAGGYCHRSDGASSSKGPSAESTVWFSDSMTPRYDWTWGGGNFYATASIRYHCWSHCTCKYNPPQKPDTTKLWHFLTSLQIGIQGDGSVNLGPSESSQQRQGPSSGTQQQVLPPQQVGSTSSRSGTCGPNHDEFCPKAWDTVAWGPIPLEPPNVTDIVKPSPLKAGVMGVCGNKCTGPQDCGTTDEQYGCSCAFPSANDAYLLGLDPVTPIAVCIALFASAVGGKGSGNGLGGRDLNGYVDERGLPHSCRCNETAVLDACCESRDGMVWYGSRESPGSID